MDSSLVYRRTPKGEREISLRSLPHEPWLALVMVDGKSSVADLVALKPGLPQVVRSLEQLVREGYIETVSPSVPLPAAPSSNTETPLAPWAHDDASAGLDLSGMAARWLRRALIVLPFAIVVAGLLVVHHSLERFTVKVEDALAAQVRNLSIGSSSFVFTPRPALRLTDIAVGQAPKVAEVVARPAWSTLLGRPGPITLIELRGATLTVADLLALLQGGGAFLADQTLRAERVTLTASRLDLDGIILAPLAGELSYGRNGQLERSALTLDDGKVQLTVSAASEGAAVELAARNWSTPTEPAVSFDRLDAAGTLERSRLVLGRVEGLVHDGLVKGDVTLDWSVGLVAEGRFSAMNIELQSLIGRFSRDFSVGGRLDADGSFAARTDNAARLIENVTVSADFRVKRGVLYNADITAAAVGDASGGTTQFEELTGTVETAGRSVSLRRIQLKSGPLTAKGTLDVTPSRQIMGHFTVRLKSQGESANTISVGGSLKQPRLQLGG